MAINDNKTAVNRTVIIFLIFLFFISFMHIIFLLPAFLFHHLFFIHCSLLCPFFSCRINTHQSFCTFHLQSSAQFVCAIHFPFTTRPPLPRWSILHSPDFLPLTLYILYIFTQRTLPDPFVTIHPLFFLNLRQHTDCQAKHFCSQLAQKLLLETFFFSVQ